MMKYNLAPNMFWPMTEPATPFGDISGNDFTATPTATGITYQNVTLPDGSKMPLFDGTAEATFATAAARAKLNGDKGSILLLAKVADTEWEDSTVRTLIQLRGGNDLISIAKSSRPYVMTAYRNAGGSDQQGWFYSAGKNDVMMLVITWDSTANQFKLYCDGLLSETLPAATWTQVFSSTYTRIGRQSSVSDDYWLGNAGYIAITDKVLSATEIKSIFDEWFPTTQNLFICGDSKAVGSTGAWRSLLLQSMETETGIRTILNPTGFAIGGHDIGEMRATVDSILAAQTATPLKILINLGANDVPEPTPEVSFKADYTYIIDAFRAKWPGVPIYVAGPILRTDALVTPEKLALINGYIAAVIATYETGVYAGLDESGFTMSDGVHYSLSDFTLASAGWMTAMGY